MASVTITEASKLAKVSRKTIYAHIKKGKVTSRLDKNGARKIDTSELMRVYEVTLPSNSKVTPRVTSEVTQGDVTGNTITLTPEQLQNIIKTAVAEALKEVVPLLLENKKEVATSGKSSTKAKVKNKVIVNEYADKLGLPSMITKELHEKIIELHNQGVSSRQIEAQLPVSRGSINRTIKASK